MEEGKEIHRQLTPELRVTRATCAVKPNRFSLATGKCNRKEKTKCLNLRHMILEEPTVVNYLIWGKKNKLLNQNMICFQITYMIDSLGEALLPRQS